MLKHNNRYWLRYGLHGWLMLTTSDIAFRLNAFVMISERESISSQIFDQMYGRINTALTSIQCCVMATVDVWVHVRKIFVRQRKTMLLEVLNGIYWIVTSNSTEKSAKRWQIKGWASQTDEAKFCSRKRISSAHPLIWISIHRGALWHENHVEN